MAYFADDVTPSGTIDGSNKVFTLSQSPNPAASLRWVENGILLTQGVDYTLSGATVTRNSAPSGAIIRAYYRY